MIFFLHTTKNLSKPIKATPAADPIINNDPPGPAQKAISCHKLESAGTASNVYMPMVAATRGTLSITADASPIKVAIIDSLGMLFSKNLAKD